MDDIFQRLRSALEDRYTVEGEIGAGGMATVYLARDLRHRRPVAIKVVRPHLGGVLGGDRFLREIEIVARLQHPHILPVFDSGIVEFGGTPLPYFVMPFVEGETLRQRLERESRLPPDEAIRLAGEIASALGYAHRYGVVHRDIKPENILLSGGHAVVADFGVAKAVEGGAAGPPGGRGLPLTAVGIAIGTPHYMSPEQATGRDEVDARADQYSLACVLYEMLVGRRPFEGDSARAIVTQAIAAPRPRAPVLTEVVARAMAPDARDRYPDMAAFAAALRSPPALIRRGHRRWAAVLVVCVVIASLAAAWVAGRRGGGAVNPEAEVLVVLPFNTSGPGVEFLGEGMVDLLTTNLNGVGGIYAIDPRAVLRRWGQTAGSAGGEVGRALAVGRDLGAGSVVVGSAVSTGGRVRLGAGLFSVAGDQLGRAQVDGPLDSVLPLVDRLSLALLRDVWRSREPVPSVRLAAVTTDSLTALRSYLEGERHYRRAAFDSALAAFTRAVEIDSTFALAHFRRALVFGWAGGYGSPESREAAAAGDRFADRLPARERRLLRHYVLFERGKPASVDSLRAFVAANPADLEARYLLAEALHHTRAFTGVSAATVAAAFDTVLGRDSALVPAALHPIEHALNRGDSTAYSRYMAVLEPTAPPDRVEAARALAGLAWGPEPSDAALTRAIRLHAGWAIETVLSAYRQERATSDSVLRRIRRVAHAAADSREASAQATRVLGLALAGLGRLGESRALVDSTAVADPWLPVEVAAWPVVMGLIPPSPALDRLLDSVASATPGAQRSYVRAIRAIIRGDPGEARRLVDAALGARGTAGAPPELRGMLLAARGWAAVAEGDSAGGIRQLREGLDSAAAPDGEDETSLLRFQLALALAAGEATRAEGIARLQHSFALHPEYIPLSMLALGRAWEAAGETDSAALAYGRFLRLWDRADPELQDRVREAREALQRVTGEPRRERT